MVEAGIKGHQEVMVVEENTAHSQDPNLAEVFSTPDMIELIEKTAYTSLQGHLSDGEGSVGTRIDVKHLAATPIGKKVWCESELIEVNKRKLTFKVEVFDDGGKVGEGTHERFIIKNAGFMDNVNNRFSKA